GGPGGHRMTIWLSRAKFAFGVPPGTALYVRDTERERWSPRARVRVETGTRRYPRAPRLPGGRRAMSAACEVRAAPLSALRRPGKRRRAVHPRPRIRAPVPGRAGPLEGHRVRVVPALSRRPRRGRG